MEYRKIAINCDFGGFGLSDEALEKYISLTGSPNDTCDWEIARDDPVLIQVIEELGEDANGNFAALKIVSVPIDVDWVIAEYDGREHIAEKHRVWY